MTKSPFPLLDPIMLGPLLAYLNLYFGTPLPELYVVTAIAVRGMLVCLVVLRSQVTVDLGTRLPFDTAISSLTITFTPFSFQIFNVLDISVLCVSLCRQICDYLNISCFTIPKPPPTRNDPH